MHVHVAGEETAWTDVLREIAIMKMLDHPNLVSLQEVSCSFVNLRKLNKSCKKEESWMRLVPHGVFPSVSSL